MKKKASTARKLRLGLIGTGIAARELYLPALRTLARRIELVACANRRRPKAEAYAKLAGIPTVVDSGEELLALPEVDAVILSLPIEAQPAYVLKALAAGKPVLSEKPIAPSLAAGRKLVKAAKRYDAPWLVGENFAFMPHVHELARWVEKGRLGTVRLVEAVQMTMMNRENPYFNTAWRQKPEFVGGFVVDGGVHVAEVVRRCFGMPTSVQSLTAQFDPALLPIDTAVAVMKLESGPLATWTSCFSARYDGPMLRVYGSKANAELFWSRAALRDAKGKETVFESEVDSFAAQFEHFADVVQRGAALAFTPEEALDDLAMLSAIVKPR